MKNYQKPCMEIELFEVDLITSSVCDLDVPPCDTETPVIPIP